MLSFPSHNQYESLHESLQINESNSKGKFVTTKQNIEACEILAVEQPIAFVVFDPQEYDWRHLPSSNR